MDIFCPWEPAQYFIFSSNTPSLFYYSHIPAIAIAIFAGAIVYIKTRGEKISLILLSICLLFSAWSLFDLVLWATNSPKDVMFFWSLQILIEPSIYILTFYLTYIFSTKQDLKDKYKILILLGYAPIVFFLSTKWNIIGINLSDCTAIENIIAKYFTYFIELIIILSILFFGIFSKKTSRSQEIKTFSAGSILFLVAFSWGNIIGSFSDNWQLAQAGLIGMPIFVFFLSYLVVKYQSFNIKVLSTQVLVGTIWFFLVSILFIRSIENVRIIVVLTLLLLGILGSLLIKSVKREVKQREQLQFLTWQLQSANEQLKILDQARAEFISIASHQLRTPPATIKWYMSSLLAGDYGPFTDDQKKQLNIIHQTNNGLISLIEDMLNVSRIERGKMEFLFTETNMLELAELAFNQLIPMATDKKLLFNFIKPEQNLPKVMADKEKIRQVMNNLIDNALKYTPKGSVTAAICERNGQIVFSVKDSGKGVSEQEKTSIFQKFSRGKESVKHSAGLGLGLYVAKIIIEQHKGKIWAESEGEGKGSTFAFSIPINSGLTATTLLDLTKDQPKT